jgi:hypothetical protein
MTLALGDGERAGPTDNHDTHGAGQVGPANDEVQSLCRAGGTTAEDGVTRNPTRIS